MNARWILLLTTAVGVLVVDVVTKAVAVEMLRPGHRVSVLGEGVSWLLTRNAGMAFSWGAGYPVHLALLTGGLVGLVIAWRGRAGMSQANAVASGLVLGGASGNLTDRMFRAPGLLRGEVVDFVSIGWSPIFNAADLCVILGAGVLAWQAIASPGTAKAVRRQADVDEYSF
jgi:signal peptidase II